MSGLDVRAGSVVLGLALALGGCVTGTTAMWRAGASRVGHEDVPTGMPRRPANVEVRYKDAFALLEETESRRRYFCATTTVLRKAFLLPHDRSLAGAPDRDYSVLAYLTTEEYPRDERASRLAGDRCFSIFGIGGDVFDLFEVQLDPDFQAAGVERLRYYASQLGADAVIDVFATGEAEHHMWMGEALGLDPRATESWFYADVRLLDFRLRDVRLHGTAVRYE